MILKYKTESNRETDWITVDFQNLLTQCSHNNYAFIKTVDLTVPSRELWILKHSGNACFYYFSLINCDSSLSKYRSLMRKKREN